MVYWPEYEPLRATEVKMTTKQANTLIRAELQENPEGVPFDTLVSQVKETCKVAQNTADAYVRRSEETQVESTMQGDKIVVSPDGNDPSATVHDGNEVLEMEVGESTGVMYGNLEVLEDTGHPEIPRKHEKGYIERRMGEKGTDLHHKTDVDVVSATMSDPDFGTLLIGKHGVGKDRLILHICAKTNRPVIRLVANDDSDFVTLLVGNYAPDENGDFRRKKGLLTIAIENGYTFILDEFNALSGKVQTMLNMILEDADQNQMVVPETNEVIQPHDEFRFVATQNPNTIGYGGREEVDHATGSRMIPVQLPSLGSEGEKKVIAGETYWQTDSPELEQLLDSNGGVVQGIRSLHDMGRVTTWVSTRDVIQIGRMTEKLGNLKAATELVLVGRVPPEDKDAIQSNIQDQNW